MLSRAARARGLLLHEIFVASPTSCVINSVGEEGQVPLDPIPARRGEVKLSVVENEHKVDPVGNRRGELEGSETCLPVVAR